ncbi:PREDICTED: cytochrome P450 18a1 [Nicrophorus vespilloides]|uniref:Cytochrome P450 18a1 n=1 Tax=Nicrophorus vespilloides TaxID=110193 RepID=A0ABM1MLF3_NICVS|nr:PREDICTED: cytochrome P450 18a1 [Nicrophorus vespilloides]
MFVYGFLWLWSVITREVSSNVLLVFVSVLMIVRILQILSEEKKLPPGPWGLPIIGSMPFLKGDLHLYYRDLAHKYGTLFSMRIGSQLMVVLSDYKMIRDTFRKEEFTGRPVTEFTKILGGYGVINTEGKLWKDQRRFLHDRLRNLGMTYIGSKKAQMESRITREVEELIIVMRAQNGASTDINSFFAISISNVICDILMSVRFSHNDTRFQRYMELIDEGFKLFGSMSPALFIPVLKYLPGLRKTRQKIEGNRKEMATFLQMTIDEHRRTFDPSHLRDVVDTYLLEIQKANEEGVGHQLFEGRDHDRQMQQIMGDLFSAGMETIKSSLQWGVLFMLHHPEKMRAVQEELDQIVGRKRLPNLEDLPYLPVTESTILEVLRISSIVPMGTTHAPTKDLNLNGYHLPQTAQVVPLLHAVHMDPKLWDEPEKFDPSRFIDAEGKVHKPEFFLPFGVGRRICLGEVLARMEIFLFFSSLLHSFDLTVPEGQTLPNLKGNAGVTINPNPFNTSLKPRPFDSDPITTTIRTAGSH